jgi:3-oxoacyl-[acyl-carrier protein] reductase
LASLPSLTTTHSSPRAVVTGSSRGIGRAIALELAAAGMDVFVHGGRDQSAVDDVVTAIGALGRSAHGVVADLSTVDGIEKLLTEVIDGCGTPDVWINNAGVDVLTGPTADWSFEAKLHALWQVDVLATIRLSRHIGAQMKARGHGVILNIGWDQAETGMEGDSGEMFAAIKGAVMAFTLSLAKSLAPQVRVNCLAPGWIKTAWGDTASAAWQDRAVAESLRARWGTPADVAAMARFLASPAADFITGQIISINGGR